MSNKYIRHLLAAALAALLLGGCAVQPDPSPTTEPPSLTEPTPPETTPAPTEAPTQPTEASGDYPLYYFPDMNYTRPDMTRAETLLDQCIELAKEDNFFAFWDCFAEFNQLSSDYNTSYILAQIYYSQDVSNETWKQERDHCAQIKAALDAGWGTLYRQMANGPLSETLSSDQYFGPGLLHQYAGESRVSEKFKSLKQQEAQLISDYYEVTAELPMDDRFLDKGYSQLAELLVELVKLRQAIARETGYDSYSDYAYGVTFNRDYTPEEASGYLELLREYLAPVYIRYYDEEMLENLLGEQTQEQTYDYLDRFTEAAGGPLRKGFEIMTNGELYDISPSDQKLNSSYTVRIPKYKVPFLFVCPTGTREDSAIFTHEFGHFCRAYAVNTNDSMDVAEFYSQGLEYLSIAYTEAELKEPLMYSSLRQYVQTAVMTDFELRLYETAPEELNADKVRKLFKTVIQEYSGEDAQFAKSIDDRSFVTYAHFFDQPLYLISYVVSNDAAMQVYELERKTPGAGLELYTNLITGKQVQFMGLIQEAQLKSPFTEARVKAVAEYFTDYFSEP